MGGDQGVFRLVHWPATDDEKDAIADTFFSKLPIPGVIGVVDTTHFHICALNHTGFAYRDHHRKFALKLLVVVDHDAVVRFFAVGSPGSWSETRTWKHTPKKNAPRKPA